MTHHLTTTPSQAWVEPSVHHLTTKNNLAVRLKSFLLNNKVEGLSPATNCDYKYKIGAFVRFCHEQGVHIPEEVSPDMVRLFILDIRTRNAPSSVLGYFKCANRFFNWMVEQGILGESPMAKMKPPKTPKKVIQPFEEDHIKRLLAMCDDGTFIGERNKAIILTFLDTGLRLSELTNIKLNDIDFDTETIKVMGKGARERVVGITKKTQKAILTYLLQRDDKYPCLWLSEERRPLTGNGIYQVISELGKRAELVDVRCSPHTFRHTFATQSLINGAEGYFVQVLLGHSTFRITEQYIKSIKSEQAIDAYKGDGRRKGFSPVDNMKL